MQNRIARLLGLAAAALVAVTALTISPAHAGGSPDFPGPVHPCLQEPCPPAGTLPSHTDFPSGPPVQTTARNPVRRPHWAFHH